MQLNDITTVVKQNLPKYTDEFNVKLDIASVTLNNSNINVVTNTSHELQTGDKVVIYGIDTLIDIVSATIKTVSGGIFITFTTGQDHDLTFGYPGFETVLISDSTVPEYNGTFSLTAVPNRRTFTILYDNTTPPPTFTGTAILNQKDMLGGANGTFTVTVTSPTEFYYTPGILLGGIIADNASICTGIRISAGGSIELTEDKIYTPQLMGELWLFVIMHDSATSNNLQDTTGATSIQTSNTDWKIIYKTTFSLYLFIPTHNNTNGFEARETALRLRAPIFNSILGYSPGTTYGENNQIVEQTVPVSDEPWGYHNSDNGAFHVHEYRFEYAEIMSLQNIKLELPTRAFRDIDFTMLDFIDENDDVADALTGKVDLDDDPLPKI